MTKQIAPAWFNEEYENDDTPSRVVAQRYRACIFEDDGEAGLGLIHYRAGEAEFELGRGYCLSESIGDRMTGADILAQLGGPDKAFLEETVSILTALLSDSSNMVVYCAAVGLGHRNVSSAIPALLRHLRNPDHLVRDGVVFGLSCHEDADAIAGLIELATDEDRDVKNWAVFGLGTQVDWDSEPLREALRVAVMDPDHEIRGEALLGLARRGEPGIVEKLLHEWRDDDISSLSLEAAEATKDVRLLERLIHFKKIFDLQDDPYFAGHLDDAIRACSPEGA